MATGVCVGLGYIKIEDTPSPDLVCGPLDQPGVNDVAPVPTVEPTLPPVIDSTPLIDPRDPDGFLKRCSGFNKSKRVRERCSAVIGKKSEQSCHPTFLPTCRAHRDQQSFAGWCQYKRPDGERCGRLFRWTPPYFELCTEHQGHPDTPCYFFNLPLELRQEILHYLIPDRPIGSSTAALHDGKGDEFDNHPTSGLIVRSASQWNAKVHSRHHNSAFPMPALDLFLVNHQFYREAKDLLFSTVPFTIDVRKDGTFMCGRRLLEPRRADGSSHYLVEEADEAKQRFLRYFDWAAVKHYVVDILVENWASGTAHAYPNNSSWDEEVELYDIRDYISVVVSGILSKSHQLNKLSVRLCLADFSWDHAQILANTKLIVGPFESLRNVRQPQIIGISTGKPNHNSMLTVQRPISTNGSRAPICSVPPLPMHMLLLVPGMLDFDAYAKYWKRWISSSNSCAMTPKAPIRGMFTEFKNFYTHLATLVPEVTYISGRHAFLHRARVAREQENVEGFRSLRNELIAYWYTYLEREEAKKKAMEDNLARMLESDVYPSHEWDRMSRGSSRTVASSSRSPKDTISQTQKRPAALLNDRESTSERKRPRQVPTSDASAASKRRLLTNGYSNTQVGPPIDSVDVGCFAHVNLSSDWYGEAGPSTKKRRIDSGFIEMEGEKRSPIMVTDTEIEEEVAYVGKGKGKMGAEVVICID
ncbi:hypothetical protein HBH47_041410 [Parastagonospora nodorum]|nr:hypothetical protein HBH47_041410 [Parastagonospora nodorum]